VGESKNWAESVIAEQRSRNTDLTDRAIEVLKDYLNGDMQTKRISESQMGKIATELIEEVSNAGDPEEEAQ